MTRQGKTLRAVMDEPDLSNIMIDATFIKYYMNASGTIRWKSRRGDLTKRGEPNTKVHVAVDARGLTLKVLISDGNVNDSQKAEELIQDFKVKYLIRGYDSKAIVEYVKNNGISVIVPARSNAKEPRNYDEELWQKFMENCCIIRL